MSESRCVQMRWVDRIGERVLQYRTLLMAVRTKYYDDDIGGRVVPVDATGDESHTSYWSEWMDVPLEPEE